MLVDIQKLNFTLYANDGKKAYYINYYNFKHIIRTNEITLTRVLL